MLHGIPSSVMWTEGYSHNRTVPCSSARTTFKLIPLRLSWSHLRMISEKTTGQAVSKGLLHILSYTLMQTGARILLCPEFCSRFNVFPFTRPLEGYQCKGDLWNGSFLFQSHFKHNIYISNCTCHSKLYYTWQFAETESIVAQLWKYSTAAHLSSPLMKAILRVAFHI